MIHASRAIRAALGGEAPRMADIFALRGEVYREPRGESRRTLRFSRDDGRGYFLKLHWGVGWREILKNLLTLRAPVLGAGNEWRAIRRLEELGVPTLRLEAYGREGWSPARQRSFVITRELEGCLSLEEYCADWAAVPPRPRDKWDLIERLARIARTLHDNGVNHRDFYLCHFLLRDPQGGRPDPSSLHLIDLHRVQLRRRTPERWRVKDIGALYFSAMDIGLTRRDLLRFVRTYDGPLRGALGSHRVFWEEVDARARALYATKPERPWAPEQGRPLVLAGGAGGLEWEETLRSLPGKRLVLRGRWGARPVIAKIYQDPKRGDVHWRRELAGLKALERAGIPAPRVLHSGRSEAEGWPLVLLTPIEPAVGFGAAWRDHWDPAERKRRLLALTRLLGRQHRAGLRQTDPHLENFLVSGETLLTLDGAGIRAEPRELGARASLDNLALLCAQLPPEEDNGLAEVYRAYAEARTWSAPAPAQVKRLARRVRGARERRLSELLEKTERECSDVIREEHPYALRLVARSRASEALWDLLDAPDASFPGAAMALKNGHTCTLWTVDVGGTRLVVKRYNVKSAWHGLKLSLRRGRAFASWRNAHLLGFFDIPTGAPVALVRDRREPRRPLAYFISEYVPGPSALAWLQDDAVPWDRKTDMARRIGELLAKLRRQRIVHGDLKATNLIISPQGPALVDLDALRRRAGLVPFARAWDRDLARFLYNWASRPDLHELFQSVMLPLRAGGLPP